MPEPPSQLVAWMAWPLWSDYPIGLIGMDVLEISLTSRPERPGSLVSLSGEAVLKTSCPAWSGTRLFAGVSCLSWKSQWLVFLLILWACLSTWPEWPGWFV